MEFGCADDAVATAVLGLFARTEGAFQALIERGQRDGDIRPEADAKAAASMLLNTITAVHVLARIEPGPDRLLRVVDATVDLLWTRRVPNFVPTGQEILTCDHQPTGERP